MYGLEFWKHGALTADSQLQKMSTCWWLKFLVMAKQGQLLGSNSTHHYDDKQKCVIWVLRCLSGDISLKVPFQEGFSHSKALVRRAVGCRAWSRVAGSPRRALVHPGDSAAGLLGSSEMTSQEQQSTLHCYHSWTKGEPVMLRFGLSITLEWTYSFQLHEIILLTKWLEDFWPT